MATKAANPPRTERVRVFCRVRPLLQREREGWSYEEYVQQCGGEVNTDPSAAPTTVPPPAATDTDGATFLTEKTKIASNTSIVEVEGDERTVILQQPGAERKEFAFDAGMGERAAQDEVYHRVAYDIVQDVLDGYNGTILAYGQTSTGKTHTMLGKDDALQGDARGIIPRAFEDIFDRAEQSRNSVKTTVALSYVQIYCERLYDLLNPENAHTGIMVREDPERGVYLDGATAVAVSSVDDCLRIIARGNANRAVASTGMNTHSSRSHAILIARIERKEYSSTTATPTATAPSQLLKLSHLYMVDLAGSERVKKTKVIGRHVNELKAINLSLSALGNCISALSRQQPQRHVPYRDSKLTRLLQSSLGGNAKTSLIITVSPSPTEAQETLSTLQFGQRAMKVLVQAHQNVLSVLDYKSLYEETQQRLDERIHLTQELESQLAKETDMKRALQDQLTKAQLRIQHLEFECRAAKLVGSEHDSKKSGNKSGSVDATALESQLAAMVKQHEDDIAAIKQKCDLQVETYKRLAEEAQQEWHELEDQLASEKHQVLMSLRELKDFKVRFFNLEHDTTDRIAELIDDDKDKERAHKNEIETLRCRVTSQDKEICDLRQKLALLEQGNQDLRDQMELEYVPKSTIKEMEQLYEGAISKLQSRVGSLEQRSTSTRKLPVANNQDPEDRTGAPTLPAIVPPTSVSGSGHGRGGKAIPKIGRIVPASRANSMR